MHTILRDDYSTPACMTYLRILHNHFLLNTMLDFDNFNGKNFVRYLLKSYANLQIIIIYTLA